MNNIDLLDYFAGKALESLLSSKSAKEVMLGVDNGYFSRMSYLIANKMIQERENYLPNNTDINHIKQLINEKTNIDLSNNSN